MSFNCQRFIVKFVELDPACDPPLKEISDDSHRREGGGAEGLKSVHMYGRGL